MIQDFDALKVICMISFEENLELFLFLNYNHT